MSERPRTPVAGFASWNGSTLEECIRATQDGRLNAEFVLAVINNFPDHPRAQVYERLARLKEEFPQLDIEIATINRKTHPGPSEGGELTEAESVAMLDLTTKHGIGHIALLGYNRILSGPVFEKYGWLPRYTSIYQAHAGNTHPGDPELTTGLDDMRLHQFVLDEGLTETAHVYQVVARKTDEGPVIARNVIQIPEWVTTAEELQGLVKGVEKEKLPGNINDFLDAQFEYEQAA